MPAKIIRSDSKIVNFLSALAVVNKQLADINRPYTLRVIQMVNLYCV